MLKRSRRILRFLVVAAIVSSATLGADAVADDVSGVLTPFVNDDTFIAARVDVAALPAFGNAGDLVKALPMLSSSADAQSWALAARVIEGVIKRFQEAGGQSVYVVAGLADLRVGGGPLAIATCQRGKGADVERLFQDLKCEQMALFGLTGGAANTPAGVFRNSVADQFQFVRKGDRVLIGTKSTVARYAALKSSPRPDVVDPLAKLVGNGAVAAAVFCPGSDYRRVVRELWPELRGALAPMRRELADRWQHIELAVNLPPDARPRVVLQARDHDAAEVFAKLWRGLPEAVTEYGGNEQSITMAKGFAQLLVGALPAKVDGTRVEITIPTSANELGKLSSIGTQVATKSMERQHQMDRMNKFKMIMIAMWNFESANKHLPPAAICDKNGKPLLSWRVAILPYVDENKLYKQFHLDEPWDSPHNLPLAAKMPDIYANSDGALRGLRDAGKTTFQVPVGPETIFHDNLGSSARDITDGTSQTIALVEVVPERAVYWTQPEDWAVDLAHPKNGIERSDRNFVNAARCDGSAHTIPLTTDEKTLRALLTRKGREVIDRQ